MDRKFGYKLLFYCLFVFYLVGDLHLWHGPLYRVAEDRLASLRKYEGDDSEVIAYVYGEPLSQNQVDRRKAELAFLRGEKKDENGKYPPSRQEALTIAAELDLIYGNLLRLKTRYTDEMLPSTKQEAGQYVAGIASRFGSGDDSFVNVLDRQKMDSGRYTNMIASRLKQLELLERFLQKNVPVTDEELDNYYQVIKGDIAIPRHRSLKHIFLPTLGKDAGQVGEQAAQLFAELKEGADFALYALNHSEDSATAAKGGDLGVITENRADLLKGIDLFELPANELVLKQSPLGWHIFHAGDIVEGRVPSLDEAKPMLRDALYAMRRDMAVRLYLGETLKEARLMNRISGKREPN